MHLPLHICPPIQVAWPKTPMAANPNGEIRLVDASASELMCAMRARLDRMPAERRKLTARLVAAAMLRLAKRRARHG